MFSIKIERWSSPRPETLKLSEESVSSTLKETFLSSSLYNLSLRCLDVTNLPSLPANGPLFTLNVIETVGSSISINSIASGLFTSAIVSPISIPVSPVTATISPADADSVSTLSNPSYVYNLPIFIFSTLPSLWHIATVCPLCIVPRSILPIPILPVYSSKSILLTRSCNGAFSSPFGSGTVSIIVSNNGFISTFSSSNESFANPFLPDA